MEDFLAMVLLKEHVVGYLLEMLVTLLIEERTTVDAVAAQVKRLSSQDERSDAAEHWKFDIFENIRGKKHSIIQGISHLIGSISLTV